MLYSRSLLAICLTYSSACILIPISQYIPLYLSPLVNINLFSEICESVSVLQISLCISCFLDSMYKWYPMSDLLYLVWQSLGPSKLLWVAVFPSLQRTEEYSIIYVGSLHLLYLSFCQCMFRLLPCIGCCQQCCFEHWGACVFSSPSFQTLY